MDSSFRHDSQFRHMTKFGQGSINNPNTPLNDNLNKLWALVTKTIGHPLHQVNKVTTQYKELGKKPHGKKSVPLAK